MSHPRNTLSFSVLLSCLLLHPHVRSSHGALIQESIYSMGPRLFNHQLTKSSNSTAVPDNLVASPLGLSFGLGLIEAAAADDLKRLIRVEFFDRHDREVALQGDLASLREVLRVAYQQKQLNENGVTASAGRVLSGEKVKNLEEVTVDLQSAIFKKEGVELLEAFKTTAVETYLSEVIDFNSSLTPSDRQSLVNSWARNATRGLIQEFPIPEQMQVLLANTVYFAGDWLEPFSNQYTRKGKFQPSADANTHLQNVMYLQGQFDDIPYYEDDSFQMIRLSYATQKDVSMLVLLPQKDKLLKDQIGRVSFPIFRDVLKNKMQNRTVNVKLPKVTLQQRTNIKSIIETLQVLRAGHLNRGDFKSETKSNPFYLSGASGDPSFVLTEFVQDTVLEVNEKGTRAAALTGGSINYDGFKKNFKCDRPYLMVIYDGRHEVVLFWAAVYKPSSS